MSVTRACGLVRVTMKRLCHCACLDVQKLCWHAQCWHLSRHEHACPFDMLSERRARLDLCARDAHVGSTGRSVAFAKIHAIVPRSFSLCLSGRTFCARPLVFASGHQKDNLSMHFFGSSASHVQTNIHRRGPYVFHCGTLHLQLTLHQNGVVTDTTAPSHRPARAVAPLQHYSRYSTLQRYSATARYSLQHTTPPL